MKRFFSFLLVAFLPHAGFAIPLVLSTATNPQGVGNNQGVWSNLAGNSNEIDRYPVGNVNGILLRSYFGFDTSALAGLTVNSATLVLSYGNGVGLANLGFDLAAVSTPIGTLVEKINNPNVTIFNSLAGGTSYGSYTLSTTATGVANLVLNSAAIADLQATGGGFFVIGGASLQAEGLPGINSLFAATDGMAATLVLDVSPAVPELDGSGALPAFAALALLLLTKGRRPRS
jgi:hypothetical protein